MIIQHPRALSYSSKATGKGILILALILLPLASTAQQFSDPWLAQYPSVDSVYEKIRGRDDLETATKQAAVFLILRESVRDSAPNRYSLSGEHQQLFLIYQTEFQSIFDRVQAEYADDNDRWLEFYRGHTRLERDNDFRLEMYEAVWPELADSYRARLDSYKDEQLTKSLVEVAWIAGTAAVVLIALVLLRRDFSSSTMSSDGAMLARRKKYQLHKASGEVLSFTKGSRTHVHGGGGTGGRSAPVTSTTYIDDNLILVDGEGKQHSVQLTNFDVNTAEGNTITAVWAIRKGKERGPFIYIYDHDTRTTYTGDTALNKMHMPSWIWNVVAAAVGALAWALLYELFGFSGGAGISVIPAIIIGVFVGIGLRASAAKRKIRRFLRSDDFQKFIHEDVGQPGGFRADPA